MLVTALAVIKRLIIQLHMAISNVKWDKLEKFVAQRDSE